MKNLLKQLIHPNKQARKSGVQPEASVNAKSVAAGPLQCGVTAELQDGTEANPSPTTVQELLRQVQTDVNLGRGQQSALNQVHRPIDKTQSLSSEFQAVDQPARAQREVSTVTSVEWNHLLDYGGPQAGFSDDEVMGSTSGTGLSNGQSCEEQMQSRSCLQGFRNPMTTPRPSGGNLGQGLGAMADLLQCTGSMSPHLQTMDDIQLAGMAGGADAQEAAERTNAGEQRSSLQARVNALFAARSSVASGVHEGMNTAALSSHERGTHQISSAGPGSTIDADAAVEPSSDGSGSGPGINLNIDYGAEITLVDSTPIGQGQFGSVFKGMYRGMPVAVKMLPRMFVGEAKAGDMEAFVQEVAMLSAVEHTNVVSFYGGCLQPPYVFIVEELMQHSLSDLMYNAVHFKHANAPGGTAAAVAGGAGGPDGSMHGSAVQSHPHAHGPRLPLWRVFEVALDVAHGLQYLHGLTPAIIHRDLKPANILLDSDGISKISDFGLARCKYQSYVKTERPEAGTLAYMAPECFDSRVGKLTDKADIFSFGVLVWEMVVGKPPWQGLKTHEFLQRMVIGGERLAVPQDDNACPLSLRRLISGCWADDPQERPSCSHIISELRRLLQYAPRI